VNGIRARGGALALGLVLTIAAPAAGCARPATPAALATLGVAVTRPAGLDPAGLQRAIQIQPGDHAAGVIAGVRLGAQAWRGQVADTVTGRAVPLDAHIRLGSITKTFEAVVALQLAARHVIDLDRPVQDYLPGLLPRRYQPITTRELLTMTSGLPQVDEGAPAETADQLIAGRYDQPALGQIIQGSLRPHGRPWPGPHFAPGTAQQYDSLNYRIAAYLIERRTGRSFADEVQRLVLRPLRLTQTFPAVSGGRPRPMPLPYLHGYIADDAGTLVDVSQQGGDDTSMISTPRDLGRFFDALFSGRLLPAAWLRQMLSVPDVRYADATDCRIGPRPGRACYGLGLQRLVLGGGTTLWGKTGSDLGYFSAYFSTLSGSVSVCYSLAETIPDGDGTPAGLRLAKAMGLAVLYGQPSAAGTWTRKAMRVASWRRSWRRHAQLRDRCSKGEAAITHGCARGA
jgi:D-alanyl-D-alanine carboxypeptidase